MNKEAETAINDYRWSWFSLMHLHGKMFKKCTTKRACILESSVAMQWKLQGDDAKVAHWLVCSLWWWSWNSQTNMFVFQAEQPLDQLLPEQNWQSRHFECPTWLSVQSRMIHRFLLDIKTNRFAQGSKFGTNCKDFVEFASMCLGTSLWAPPMNQKCALVLCFHKHLMWLQTKLKVVQIKCFWMECHWACKSLVDPQTNENLDLWWFQQSSTKMAWTLMWWLQPMMMWQNKPFFSNCKSKSQGLIDRWWSWIQKWNAIHIITLQKHQGARKSTQNKCRCSVCNDIPQSSCGDLNKTRARFQLHPHICLTCKTSLLCACD